MATRKIYWEEVEPGLWTCMVKTTYSPEERTYWEETTHDYSEGYDLGKRAKLGDDLPHPSNWKRPESFYHGMRAALGGRDLDISAFLRVIKRDPKWSKF